MTTATLRVQRPSGSWSNDRVQVLVEMLLAGASQRQIAGRLGVATNTIASRLNRMRIDRDPRLPPSLSKPDPKMQRNMRRALKGRVSAGKVSAPITDAPAPIAARDPCWRCGVRGDVGCVHQPLMSA